jgi:hypothetical protein
MIKRRLIRFVSGTSALLFGATLSLQVFLPGTALAAPAQQITNRSLTLEPGATDGGSLPGGTVNHLFKFTLNDTTSNLGAIVFQYCTTAAAVPGGVGCVAPADIDTSGVTMGAASGATGFTATPEAGWDDANDTVNNAVLLSRAPANLGGGPPVAVSLELDSIKNPSAVNTTFFVRIWTFSTSTITYTPATGAPLDLTDSNDAGTVAASTTSQELIHLTGTMPESLVFCTGHTIAINTSDVPDCTTATSGAISFNQLFSPSSTSWATSQMAASTNAGSGYVITVNGPTLTSGSNTITAIGATAAASQLDTRQFGLNLVDDTADTTLASSTPALSYFDANGGSVYPASDGTNFMAQPASSSTYTTAFDTASSYAFVPNTNNIVAASDYSAGGSTGTPLPTNTQRYTATYIVNVSGNQPAGSYTSTLTYVCTPTF